MKRGSGRGPRLLIGKWTWGAACGMAVMDVGVSGPGVGLIHLSAGSPGFYNCPLWGLRVFIQGCRGIQRQMGGSPGTQAVSQPSGVDSEYASERERRIMQVRGQPVQRRVEEVQHLRNPVVVLSG